MKIILGLGVTGFSCAKYFAREGIAFEIVDTRPHPPLLSEFSAQFPTVPVHLGGLYETVLKQADEIILSPGISPHLPELVALKNQGLSIIGDVELFARVARAPIIVITGSNAKGTVTTLVSEMIKQAGQAVLVGGNIGTPCLDLLSAPVPKVYVLELSSFQLESTHSLHPYAATILNISADHLDRHGNMANYIAAKQGIYSHCQYAVYNSDDKATYPTCLTDSFKHITFGLMSPHADFHLLTENDQTYLAHHQQKLLSTRDLKILGTHNWANALAALALGSTLSLPLDAMRAALLSFSGLPHRCQWIGEWDHIPWYDDSKGTNVGASLAAIQGLGPTLSGKIVLIAGGMGKGADFTLMQEALSNYVKTAILFGQDAPLLAQAFKTHTDIIRVTSLAEAVLAAKNSATQGDIVLLSPACASLDMFKDYHHRGEMFVATFNELRQSNAHGCH
ncbi:MAG: UDP-N-acetylmuramoyl-L-alanine--D-glutamate ligase [Gammaproteobacteria bacterium]|nr:UDP-N-acetylmuramoyl-L-alanine--D-glutamate ligase [Gammaproteobacteria bacterium]